MRKVAIVGGDINNGAPLNDPSWEIWTVGRCINAYPRITRAYEMHTKGVAHAQESERDIDHAVSIGIEVWMRNPLPGTKQFPLKDVHEQGGYVTNTVSWMLAHALYEKVDTVFLYGCPMCYGGEYEFERPSVLYWIGLLKGAGILVVDKSEIVDWAESYGEKDK